MPREISTVDADLQAYQEQRGLFFQAQAAFKAGNIDMGILCCGYLHAMFGIQVAPKYVMQNKEGTKKFIDRIDKLRQEITIYRKCKEIPKSGNYLEYADYDDKLGNQLDDVFIEFLEIKNKTETELPV